MLEGRHLTTAMFAVSWLLEIRNSCMHKLLTPFPKCCPAACDNLSTLSQMTLHLSAYDEKDVLPLPC